VFFHGSVTPNRGLAETIQALSILKSKKVPFRFTIIGDGNYLSFLKKKVISLELDDYVIFREPEDYNKMPYYISKADICTMAYPTGGFWEGNVPLKLLEYMAMGKVVLCSNLKVFKDISKEAKFALFIDDNSPEKIAEALIFAWINKDSLHEWGVSGCEIVSKEYTWEAISNNIHSYITSMGSTKLIL
jgi:glycosyltransferase involved in cell wall biosynthesis